MDFSGEGGGHGSRWWCLGWCYGATKRREKEVDLKKKKSGEWDKRVAYEFFLLNPK